MVIKPWDRRAIIALRVIGWIMLITSILGAGREVWDAFSSDFTYIYLDNSSWPGWYVLGRATGLFTLGVFVWAASLVLAHVAESLTRMQLNTSQPVSDIGSYLGPASEEKYAEEPGS